jgi:preprotein translocase subunit YajC
MEVNWTVLGILAFCAIILIVYLIRRNRKDEKDVEKFFNEEKIIEKESDKDDVE